MDVLNKLCNTVSSTVSSTVSQLSVVLPGNPVTREYEPTAHIASAGTGLLWKIYTGYKKSTQEEAAIFVLEKRQLERWSKGDRDVILDHIRKGILQLARLRHPQILTVQHMLEESRECLAFAAEPVFASLANTLGKIDNMPSPLPRQFDKFSLYDVEIKYGLLQIAEGLSFLHNDARMLHRNICPHNIIINKQGAWKIFGFDFSVRCISGAEAEVRYPSVEYHADMHEWVQPNLDYLAPECGMSGDLRPASDVYSLGMLIYAIYNHGRPLYSSGNLYSAYRENISKLKKLSASNLEAVHQNLREIVLRMLQSTPELRPDIHQFSKVNFFEDVGVKALSYLDSLFQWDNLQKSQFYKGLPQVINKLPHRVCLFRVIPCLAKEFVNPTMVPFVLPSVFAIVENSTKEEFVHSILPYLKTVIVLKEPIQILLIFMQKMELLLKLTPAEDIRNYVLPVLFRALELNIQQLQELCLSTLPTFATLIEHTSMKNSLIPRIKKLCVATSYISVRVNCLVCIGKLVEHLDRWLILDDILPFLPEVPSREPAVIMSIIGIYRVTLSNNRIKVPIELLARNALPFLFPLTIENSLTNKQFRSLMSIIREIMSIIELEQGARLEQLQNIREEQESLESNTTGTSGFASMSGSPGSDLEDLFGVADLNINGEPSKISETRPSRIIKGGDRRLSDQHVLQRNLQDGPTLNPSKVTSRAPVHTLKDLTSTLIDNNLAQMNHASSDKQILFNQMNHTSHNPIQFPSPIQSFSSNSFSSTVARPVFSLGNIQSLNQIQPVKNKIPADNFATPSASFGSPLSSNGLSPAAFFTSGGMLNSKDVTTAAAKPLTSTEINDFLS